MDSRVMDSSEMQNNDKYWYEAVLKISLKYMSQSTAQQILVTLVGNNYTNYSFLIMLITKSPL